MGAGRTALLVLAALSAAAAALSHDDGNALGVPHVSVIKLKPNTERKKEHVAKISEAFATAVQGRHPGKFKLTVVDRETIALQAMSMEDALLAKDLVLKEMVEAHEVTVNEESFRRPEDEAVSLKQLKQEAAKGKRVQWFTDVRRRIMNRGRSLFRKKQPGVLFAGGHAAGRKEKRKVGMVDGKAKPKPKKKKKAINNNEL